MSIAQTLKEELEKCDDVRSAAQLGIWAAMGIIREYRRKRAQQLHEAEDAELKRLVASLIEEEETEDNDNGGKWAQAITRRRNQIL